MDDLPLSAGHCGFTFEKYAKRLARERSIMNRQRHREPAFDRMGHGKAVNKEASLELLYYVTIHRLHWMSSSGIIKFSICYLTATLVLGGKG